MAHVSTIITSGSRLAFFACAIICRFMSSGNRESLGSSIEIFGAGFCVTFGSYHGLTHDVPGGVGHDQTQRARGVHSEVEHRF
jgi:hypothetical protein